MRSTWAPATSDGGYPQANRKDRSRSRSPSPTEWSSTAPRTGSSTRWTRRRATSRGGPRPTARRVRPPAVVDRVLYLGTVGSVYALDDRTGTVARKTNVGGDVWSAPALADGRVHLGNDDNSVYAFDASSGEVLWASSTGAAVYSSPAVVDGKVVVGGFDQSVHAFDAVTGDLRWATPTRGRSIPRQRSPTASSTSGVGTAISTPWPPETAQFGGRRRPGARCGRRLRWRASTCTSVARRASCTRSAADDQRGTYSVRQTSSRVSWLTLPSSGR